MSSVSLPKTRNSSRPRQFPIFNSQFSILNLTKNCSGCKVTDIPGNKGGEFCLFGKKKLPFSNKSTPIYRLLCVILQSELSSITNEKKISLLIPRCSDNCCSIRTNHTPRLPRCRGIRQIRYWRTNRHGLSCHQPQRLRQRLLPRCRRQT